MTRASEIDTVITSGRLTHIHRGEFSFNLFPIIVGTVFGNVAKGRSGAIIPKRLPIGEQAIHDYVGYSGRQKRTLNQLGEIIKRQSGCKHPPTEVLLKGQADST